MPAIGVADRLSNALTNSGVNRATILVQGAGGGTPHSSSSAPR